MKNISLSFFVISIFFSCEEPQDITPPSLNIISHVSNQIVSGISTIIVTTEDNESVGGQYNESSSIICSSMLRAGPA